MACSFPHFRTHPSIALRWKQTARSMALNARTPAELRRWQAKARKKLIELTGYDRLKKVPLRAEITERVELVDHIRERAVIQVEAGVAMPFYILTPKEGAGPYPVVVCPHGHGVGGKMGIAGRRDIPQVAGDIDKANCDYGLQFVRAGFMAFCPDARGFGERHEHNTADLAGNSCQSINQMAMPLGLTVIGLWVWDIHRLVDYIRTRKDCRADAIGCAGLSGGGSQTLWAAALDTRIRAAITSGYFYGYKEALLDLNWNCSCNFVPHLWEYMDMGDIAALIAPRGFYVETGTKDDLNGARGAVNAIEPFKTVTRAYKILKAADMATHEVFDGGHVWRGVNSIPWMQRLLT